MMRRFIFKIHSLSAIWVLTTVFIYSCGSGNPANSNNQVDNTSNAPNQSGCSETNQNNRADCDNQPVEPTPVQISYQYDDLGRLKSVSHSESDTAMNYSHDENGNIVSTKTSGESD